MKPQQRKFIVEVKSARRRPATRPASIWGDTDLKALARAAENEAPHLFATVGQAANPAAPQRAEGSSEDGRTAGGALATAGPAAVAEEAAVTPAHFEDASEAQPIADLPIKLSHAPKRPRPMPVRRRPRSKTVMTAAPVGDDEVAALEEENRGLKELLAQRLQQENTLLRQMLERFGAN
ncbi:hypothetical protein ACQKGL_16950 [Ensifer adhaerens]|uniref:hypothetical protein n=1 Tax=Ensifer adhaerens TaxID=106592 RepID=UPI003CFC446D